jgi:general stress protein 26
MPDTPGPTDVALNDEIAQILTEDVHDRPVAVAYVGHDGRPQLSFRGSTHVHSPQQLAIWARKKDSGLAVEIANQPDVSLLFFKPSTHTFLSFTGRAHVDPSADETVWGQHTSI